MTAVQPMHPAWLAWPLLSMLAACQPSADRPGAAVAPEAPTASATTPAVPASPWDAAAARGVGFRAVGNEPGWWVEVDRGDAPALRATLDYGDRTIEVPRAAALEAGALGYRGATADGTPVILRIRRQACSDGMSDLSYDTSATLNVGDETHQGCGRFLGD